MTGFRPRAEVAILLVLTLGIGSLFGWRALTGEPSSGSSSIVDPPGVIEQQLRCLKVVTEEAFAEAQEMPEASSPGLFEEGAPASLQDVVAKVQEVRGLTFEDLPEPTYLSLEALADRAAGYAEEYPDAEATVDSALLSSLGAVPEGSDLKDLTATALSEQVAGFYDTETKEIVVSGDPEVGLDSIEQITLAHELDHALADQVLGLPIEEGFPPEGAEDSVQAATALVEGDATLTMSLYSVEASFLAPTAAILGTDAGGAAGVTQLPHYLQRSMIFPYIEGLGFVCGLYMDGGWAAVNEAYQNPPTTTAQILFPMRYAEGEEAIDPRDSESPGPGWTRTDVQAFGAADLLFLFEAPGDKTAKALTDPLARARAWAGGEVQLWTWRGGLDYATAILLVQREGEQGLCDSVRDWYQAAFPHYQQVPVQPGERMATRVARDSASLRCPGNEVRLGIGLDLPTARRLVR